MTRILCAVCLLMIASGAAVPDELKRSGLIGVMIARADESKPPTADTNPVVVRRVIDGSAAAEAGLEPGDILRTADGKRLGSPADFAGVRRYAGDRVHVTLDRNGQTLSKDIIVKARPFETSPNADVFYRSVTVHDARRRVIVTKPKRDGRFPAVILMGGLGCYSLDGQNRENGYGRILSAFEEKGFVTMRVEKTGEGDSEGPRCSDLTATAQLEADGLLAGLRALKSYDFVDPKRVFALAHSIGPVIGSLVVPHESLKGFIAVETIGTSWYEYDIERSRLQETLTGTPLDEVDRSVREYNACSFRFFVEKQNPDQLAKAPDCRRVLEPFGNVPYTYMHQVGDINLAAQWKQADIPVLVIYGTASPVTTARQSRYLADTINSFHPGRATYIEVPGMGHDFARYESQADYMRRDTAPHPFHTGVLDAIFTWLDKMA